ncbi:MAG: YceI family protein [Actinomycetota bacterium]
MTHLDTHPNTAATRSSLTPTSTPTSTSASTTGASGPPPRPRRSRRWLLWAIVGLIAVVALGYGAIFVYTTVINDAPDALDEADLTSALEADSPSVTPSEVATPEAPNDPAPSAAADLDGTWVPTGDSAFGYRVEEVLAGVNVTAVGRSNEIDGQLTIDGTTAQIEAVVQVENITSDDGRRDGQFRGRIMDAANFPTATFATTQPIDVGAIPADGEQVVAPVDGELTLKGVTQPISFDVTAQRTGERIGVLGAIPVAFADYGIDNPSFGAVKTEDVGLVEFVLVFEQS